jgi:signal transduction histidine kinase
VPNIPSARMASPGPVVMANAEIEFGILEHSGCPLREFKAGDTIFRRGEAGHELFIVKSGGVEIRVGNRVLDTLSEHSIFGEMALIDSAPRSATAVAVTDTTLIAVSESQLKPLISDFSLTIMREMSRRLRAHARQSELMNIDAITGSIAHEIKQPLTAIAANSSAAQRFLKMREPDLEQACISLSHLVDDVHRTSDIIDGIRSLFRGVDRTRQLINLNEITLEVLESMSADLKFHDVTSLPDLGKIPPVDGSRIQLGQVLINIIRNAVEAMETVPNRRKILRVSTRPFGPNAIMVAVEDSGPGIDRKKIDEIFDAFVTTKSHGIGLGLAICRVIIEHHGGQLTATSDGKNGTRFDFVLPAAKDPEDIPA